MLCGFLSSDPKFQVHIEIKHLKEIINFMNQKQNIGSNIIALYINYFNGNALSNISDGVDGVSISDNIGQGDNELFGRYPLKVDSYGHFKKL